MSSPRLSNRKRRYDDKLWSTYITEAIQSGNATQYCTDKNIPYRTYQQRLAEYNKREDKENWSPNSNVDPIIAYSLTVLRSITVVILLGNLITLNRKDLGEVMTVGQYD